MRGRRGDFETEPTLQMACSAAFSENVGVGEARRQLRFGYPTVMFFEDFFATKGPPSTVRS